MSPEAVPSNASVASTGKGLRYIGDYAYAYSGLLTTTGAAELTLLDFVSGSGLINSGFQFSNDWEELGASYMEMQIIFNGEHVYFNVPRGNYQGNQDFRVELIIPPFTRVQVIVKPQAGTPDAGATMTGRVYD